MPPTGDGRIAFELRDPTDLLPLWLYPSNMQSEPRIVRAMKQGADLRVTIDAERKLAPPELYEVGSMLSYDERLLLHWAARTGPAGAIVDLGSFLGGSTLALAHGARAREPRGSDRGPVARVDSPRVHAYDRFELCEDWEHTWLPEGFTLGIGDSTRGVFEHNIAAVRDLVEVHEGDVQQQTWHGAISVLFVDITKSWETADAVWRTFLPALIPGESLVIQQDLAHWGHPWCAIIMELFADRFEYLGWVWFSSAVYQSTASISAVDLPVSTLDALSSDEALELVDRAAARLGEPIAGSVRLSGALVLGVYGCYDAARNRVGEIRDGYGTSIPYIDDGLAWYEWWLDAVEAGKISPLTGTNL
jgi:hypothetical protein